MARADEIGNITMCSDVLLAHSRVIEDHDEHTCLEEGLGRSDIKS